MSRIEDLKASIDATLNEIIASHNHFAVTRGVDLRDDTYRQCMETVDRIERKMLSVKKSRKRKPSTTD